MDTNINIPAWHKIMVTKAEAAALLSRSEREIDRLREAGLITNDATKRHCIVFHRAELERFAANACRPITNPTEVR